VLLVSISLCAHPDKRAELLHTVDVAVVTMRSLPACERCRLLVDTENTDTFTLLSEWNSGSEAEAFFNSREFQMFRSVRSLLKEEPVIVFDEVGSRVARLIFSPKGKPTVDAAPALSAAKTRPRA
jgi:quinol monooxygenase YgiN